MLVMAPSTMGLAGMATGAVLGWTVARRSPDSAEPDDAEADVPTSVVAHRQAGSKADE